MCSRWTRPCSQALRSTAWNFRCNNWPPSVRSANALSRLCLRATYGRVEATRVWRYPNRRRPELPQWQLRLRRRSRAPETAAGAPGPRPPIPQPWRRTRSALPAEGLGHHQRRQQRRRQQGGDGFRPRWQLPVADEERSGGLDGGVREGDGEYRGPERDRLRLPGLPRPSSSVTQAAMTGTPGGVNGTRTRARAAASSATSTALRPPLLSSSTSRARKNAGKIASSSNRSTSPTASPASAPTTVPTTQAAYCGTVAPMRCWRSKRPPPRLASAHETSTTA